MKTIIAKILAVFTRLILMKFKPVIVGITGSVGKTSTKEAVSAVLDDRFQIRSTDGNYNNEFGLPLTVIGSKSAGKNPFGWLMVFIKALRTLLGGRYPQVLILEMGSDKPGDIAYLLKITGPLDYAIVTDIGISHMMNYSSVEALAKEKLSLVKGLKPTGTAILNLDNEHIKKFVSEKKSDNFFTYGFNNQDADLSVADYQLSNKDGNFGIIFKMKYKGTIVPAIIPNSLGQSNVYAALAGAGVGLKMGMNLVEVGQALSNYVPPAGRLRMIKGIKNTQIIDDTYNAAPSSTKVALDVLNQIAKGRKVVAIGGMAELGSQNEAGHKEVAAKIQEVGVKLVFLIGENARIIKDELDHRQFNGVIKWFENSDNARIPIQNEIMEGDTILVKGSQSARTEKIVKEIMADPESAEKLLVRQSEYWQTQ